MKVKDIIRLIRQDGWYEVRTRGDHRQFHHPVRRGTVTVAGKLSDELHPKTRKSVLKQAGIDES
jgi:predicted RNA binding protein YcfA (HicA-like mRNA interferase family)